MEYIPLYLVSNDTNSFAMGGPIEYGWTTPLSTPIQIDSADLGNWQVVLTGASFYHPGPASPLFVYCSMVSSVSVGSGNNPLLCIIPAAAAAGTYAYVATCNPPQYAPINAVTNNISVWIRDKFGNAPSHSTPGTTSISLMLVRQP